MFFTWGSSFPIGDGDGDGDGDGMWSGDGDGDGDEDEKSGMGIEVSTPYLCLFGKKVVSQLVSATVFASHNILVQHLIERLQVVAWKAMNCHIGRRINLVWNGRNLASTQICVQVCNLEE